MKFRIWKKEFEGDKEIDEYCILVLNSEIWSYLKGENNLRYSIGKGIIWNTK